MKSSALSSPGWLSSTNTMTFDQAASRAGVTNIVLHFTEFDFTKALSFIKGRLSPEFVKDYWLVSIADASRSCHISRRKVSICWFSVKFLDVLWCLLFSRTAGPSPWYHLLDGLNMTKPNGTADSTIDVVTLSRNIFKNPQDAETIMHGELDEFFPMKIAMPENITPAPSTGNSKRPAADDLDRPRTQIKDSSSNENYGFGLS